ncbi:hypothetical protein BC941DRAFT_348203 [Chlamydoabsidia padenii]|nr:hypothetical protein BC941DRAFT_348203 [Chlamydoabsidia padenii]
MDYLRQVPSYVYISSLIFSAVLYRKFGGYRSRGVMAIALVFVMAIYGMLAALFLPLFGKAGLINYTVGRGYYYLGRVFTGVRCTIMDEHNLLESPAVYVCNHQSSLDIMVMGAVFPKNTSVVAKKEIKYYPFLGWFMILGRAIFLDRKNRTNAVKQAKQASDDIHRKKISVWLFPEGTRGHSSKVDLLPFKKGAFHMAVQARVPIVPVVFANYSNIYSTKAKRFVPGNINIKVLPPVLTHDIQEDSASIDELSVRVRESMLTALREISPPTKDE